MTRSETKFQERKRIGLIGEMIVRKHLKKHGWNVYAPCWSDSFPVDAIQLRPTDKGFDLTACEVKTYSRRFCCEQTGIDRPDFYTYCDLAKIIKLTIVFVDPFEEMIYALPFNENKDKGTHESRHVYFDLALMTKIRPLTKEELKAINWKPDPHYRHVQKYFQ